MKKKAKNYAKKLKLSSSEVAIAGLFVAGTVGDDKARIIHSMEWCKLPEHNDADD